MQQRPNTREVAKFILAQIRDGEENLVKTAVDRFGISRQAVYGRISRMVDQGLLVPIGGKTRARRFALKRTDLGRVSLPVSSSLEESAVWLKTAKPWLSGLALPQNLMSICAYGFTEMVNNVIDHSESEKLDVEVYHNPLDLGIEIRDDGIGIFYKIKNALGLDDERQSILELSKGKFTTDPQRHSGEGIFFTSRIFDSFAITSRGVHFRHFAEGDDWLVDDWEFTGGTRVRMEIAKDSTRTTKDVIDRYSKDDESYSFSKTHVPISLARYGDDNLISRSQAKRVLSRFERFEEVMLDFHGVASIGQAFADEIFRVFRIQNPQIEVYVFRANKEVQDMISRAESAWADQKAAARKQSEGQRSE